MTAPTYAGVVTHGTFPASNQVSFTQPAGDAFAFVIVVPENVTPTTPTGFTLLGSKLVDYVDYHVYGRDGGGGSTVTVAGVANQQAIAGVSFNAPKSDWLTSRVVSFGPDATLSVTTGTLPADSLLISFLAARDNTGPITVTAPGGMTLRGQVSAEFDFRHAAVATSTPAATTSQTLTWACATPLSAAFGITSLAVPGVVATGPHVRVAGAYVQSAAPVVRVGGVYV